MRIEIMNRQQLAAYLNRLAGGHAVDPQDCEWLGDEPPYIVETVSGQRLQAFWRVLLNRVLE